MTFHITSPSPVHPLPPIPYPYLPLSVPGPSHAPDSSAVHTHKGQTGQTSPVSHGFQKTCILIPGMERHLGPWHHNFNPIIIFLHLHIPYGTNISNPHFSCSKDTDFRLEVCDNGLEKQNGISFNGFLHFLIFHPVFMSYASFIS